VPTETIRVLFSELIDYAGLFPPAKLDMASALRNYAAYQEGKYAWMLGRFVVPSSQRGAVDPAWPVSVLDSVPERIEIAGDVTYYEVPLDTDPATLRDRAKIRLGGDAIPDAAAIAGFLRRYAEARVAFKATAGLHHPLPTPPMHGFVNLFLGAALAWQGEDPLPTLEERSATAFHFGDDAVEWHGHALTVAQLVDARERFAISFGSCSFEEPVEDLKALGWL
jgi:hypothetical protein